MSIPQTTAAWVLNSQNGAESLEYREKLPLPALKEDEILVKIYAASLNYRDLGIAQGDFGQVLSKKDTVPGSDGAGVVEAVGSNVTSFRSGDRVCTHLTVGLSDDDVPGFVDITSGLGHKVDGTLQGYGVFHETSLVKMPSNLSFLEAATLTCSGLTAYNALFGIEDRSPKAGKVFLVQGTGGVSIAALQFALAAGATVIATTSSEDKAKKLKELGAHQVVNYRTTPNWGEKVKELSPDGKGAHIIVDVGGASTLQQSFKAIRNDGVIAATGVLRDSPDGKVPSVMDCIFSCCTTRGLFLGTRTQFEAMNRFIEKHDIKPILDDKKFDLSSVKEAYTYMIEQRHFSKIGITISE